MGFSSDISDVRTMQEAERIDCLHSASVGELAGSYVVVEQRLVIGLITG